MTTWFTSDTHYGHANVIGFCDRPFMDVVHMENALAGAHNAIVKPDDIVYHLGDFIWSPKPAEWLRIFDMLNGRFRIIRGNHDLPLRKNLALMLAHPKIEWVKDYAEEKIDGIKVVLCHYPLGTWNRARHGSFHLHGHCHGTWTQSFPRSIAHGRSMDVGVDCWDYRPLSFENVRGVLEAIEPRDGREYEINDQGGDDES